MSTVWDRPLRTVATTFCIDSVYPPQDVHCLRQALADGGNHVLRWLCLSTSGCPLFETGPCGQWQPNTALTILIHLRVYDVHCLRQALADGGNKFLRWPFSSTSGCPLFETSSCGQWQPNSALTILIHLRVYDVHCLRQALADGGNKFLHWPFSSTSGCPLFETSSCGRWQRISALTIFIHLRMSTFWHKLLWIATKSCIDFFCSPQEVHFLREAFVYNYSQTLRWPFLLAPGCPLFKTRSCQQWQPSYVLTLSARPRVLEFWGKPLWMVPTKLCAHPFNSPQGLSFFI